MGGRRKHVTKVIIMVLAMAPCPPLLPGLGASSAAGVDMEKKQTTRMAKQSGGCGRDGRGSRMLGTGSRQGERRRREGEGEREGERSGSTGGLFALESRSGCTDLDPFIK
jgi:hypothetical protein